MPQKPTKRNNAQTNKTTKRAPSQPAKKPVKRTQAQNEELELERAYHKAAGGKYAKKNKKSSKSRALSIVVICLSAALLISGLFLGYLAFGGGIEKDKILSNVSIMDVNIGGMTKEEAAAAMTQAFNRIYGQESMYVRLLEHSTTLTSDTVRISLDTDAAVEAAYSYGRTGSFLQKRADRKQAEKNGIAIDFTSYMTLDAEAIRSELVKLASNYSTILVQSSCELKGDRPVLTEDPAENEESQKLVITMGTPGYDLDIDKLYQQVISAYKAQTFRVEYDCNIANPTPPDLDAAFAEFCVQPVDAVMDPKTFVVSPHSYGYTFDLNSGKQFVSTAQFGQSFEIPFTRIEPQTRADTLEAILFRDTLAQYTAYNGSSSARNTNLRLACEAVNGTVLLPGEVFDYNQTLGERTKEKGYQEAATYINGDTIMDIGGGICQVSSTIYYCALLSDMEIVTRYNHGYISTYVPYGMDATVSWGGPDFRFRNSSDYPIRIEATSNYGNVTVKLMGTDTKDYYVRMEYDIIETTPYEVVYKGFAPDNDKGFKDGDQVVSPYTGYKVETYRLKYDKETGRRISKTLEATNIYAKRDKVICKILLPGETLPPNPTEPPEVTLPPETTAPPETTVPPVTTLPPETTVPPATTAPPETTVPPVTTLPPETTAPPVTTVPPETPPPGVGGSENVEEG